MLTTAQAILLGALQGFTELFPISSLGHTVLLPSLLGWQINQDAEFFIVFLVATHFATALVLFAFYFEDWWKIAAGFFRSCFARRIPEGDTYARISWLLIVATIPAGFLGLMFQHTLRDFFASPIAVSLFLIGNGALLYGAELMRIRGQQEPGVPLDDSIAHLRFKEAFGIGVAQALALFPGFSRTGATLAGGLISGLSHASAIRFSFLLATPIIAAAAALKLPHLLTVGSDVLAVVLIGAAASALAAYLSVRYLTKYFKTHTLVPFAIYCAVAGLVSLIILF